MINDTQLLFPPSGKDCIASNGLAFDLVLGKLTKCIQISRFNSKCEVWFIKKIKIEEKQLQLLTRLTLAVGILKNEAWASIIDKGWF